MYTKIQPWCVSDECQIRDSVLPLEREWKKEKAGMSEKVIEWERRNDLLIEYNENGSMNELSEWALTNEATDDRSGGQKIIQTQDFVAVYCRYCCFPFYVLNENWLDRLVRVGARQRVILKLVDSLHQHQSNRIKSNRMVFDWWHIEIVQILFKSSKALIRTIFTHGQWRVENMVSNIEKCSETR